MGQPEAFKHEFSEAMTPGGGERGVAGGRLVPHTRFMGPQNFVPMWVQTGSKRGIIAAMSPEDLRVIVSESGLTQKQFSEKAGYPFNTFKKFVSGGRDIPRELIDFALSHGYKKGTNVGTAVGTTPYKKGTDPEIMGTNPEKGTVCTHGSGSNQTMGTKNHGGSAGSVPTPKNMGTNSMKVARASKFGPEWDIMEDGYARGYPARGKYPADSNPMRVQYRTPGALLRIVEEFSSHLGPYTKKDWDKVDWKKLALPNFEKTGLLREKLK